MSFLKKSKTKHVQTGTGNVSTPPKYLQRMSNNKGVRSTSYRTFVDAEAIVTDDDARWGIDTRGKFWNALKLNLLATSIGITFTKSTKVGLMRKEISDTLRPENLKATLDKITLTGARMIYRLVFGVTDTKSDLPTLKKKISEEINRDEEINMDEETKKGEEKKNDGSQNDKKNKKTLKEKLEDKKKMEDKKKTHSINKERIKLMEQQFAKESQYKKACEDRDIEEYKEYERAVDNNVNATEFNNDVSKENIQCIELVVTDKLVDERNLKKQIIKQCLLGIRVNILHSGSCAIPAEIKELQDAQNALKEKRKTLVKEFNECKKHLMNEWRDTLLQRNKFGQFIGWLRGESPQSFIDAINGSKLHVEKIKYLISIFSANRDQLEDEIQQLFENVEIKSLLTDVSATPDVEHENMSFSTSFLTISARIATAKEEIDDFNSLKPLQYKWRLTYRYLPIFVVPYADAIKYALKSEFLTNDHVFGTIDELIQKNHYEDASFELIKYMKNVYKEGVHVKFFDLLSKTIGGLSQSEESKVCASELEAFHSSLLPTKTRVVKGKYPFVSITSLPYSPLHIEWLELKKRLRELFDKNSGYTLAIQQQKAAVNKLNAEQKKLDAEQNELGETGAKGDTGHKGETGPQGDTGNTGEIEQMESDVYSDADGETKNEDISTPAPFDIWRSNEAMDKIIRDHVGMENIKRHCLTLYKNRLAQVTETESAQPELPLNFQFIGNPGTGKTTIARLLGDVLFYTSLRPAIKPREMPTPPKSSSGGIGKRAGKIGWNLLTGNLWGVGTEVLKAVGGDTAQNKAAQAKYKLELAKMGPGEPYFQEESAASLLVMKAEGVTGLLNNMRKQGGGILFIDEAYSLDPENEDEGKKIFELIMIAAENDRKSITIILAGYKREIEKNLNAYNPGLPRRFPSVYEFHDYSDDELLQILQLMLKKTRSETNPDKYSGWFMKDAVARVLIRRIARQRGVSGFGNAGTVRNQLYEKIMRASNRLGLGIDQGPGIGLNNNNESDTESQYETKTNTLGTVVNGTVLEVTIGTVLEVTIEDIIGPNPVINPRVYAALAKLEDFVGLDSVKGDIKNLVDVASKNWQRESRCLTPFPVMLNRLFVGKPGTGKTSIATIYGEILGAVGYLSDGSVNATVASDYVGSYSGEAQKKTVAIMEASKGKVLIIDEAYVLSQSEFGRQALDVLVERVSPKPGTDMAVILAGYKENILKMCREENPGLGRRFDVSHPIVFEDYDDNALEQILMMKCRKERIMCPLDVRKAVIKKIAMQRQQTSFGNAGEVENMLSRAKRKAIARPGGEFMLSLTMGDFDINETPDIDEIISELEKTKTMPEIVAHIKRLQTTHNFFEKRKEINPYTTAMPSPGHYIFMGNSGTGKTFVAKKMGFVFYQLGLVSSSEMVITSAPDLMGTVVGEAQKLVRKKMEEALGGTLFIDEAYQLGKGQYGAEAQTQLIATLEEDKYKNNIIVILAGYKKEMNIMMAQNQGMRSRFTQQFEIKDWDPTLCLNFIVEQLRLRYCILKEDRKSILEDFIERLIILGNFANGRDCKNIAKKISEFAYSNKIDVDGNAIVTKENIKNALDPMITNRSPDKTKPVGNVTVGNVNQEEKEPGRYHQFVAKKF